jgi:hypothetical protein
MNKIINFLIITLPLAVAGFFFGHVSLQCSQIFNLAVNSPRELIGISIMFFIALAILLVCAGLAVVLVRPLFAGILCFGVSAIAILLVWGFSTANLLFAGIYWLLSIFYYFDSLEEIEQRIHFSIKPLIDKQNVFLAGLLIILAVNVFRGADAYLVKNEFHVPKQFVQAISSQVIKNAKSQLPADTQVQSDKVLTDEVSDKLSNVVDDQIKPFKQYIPLILALGVFFLISTVARVLLWLPMVLVRTILSVLIWGGLVKVVNRQVEIERLTMEE